jgi:predicted ATPase
MLALYRSGRQAEALEAYRAARTALVEELGIEPSAAIKQLEQAILAQDPELLSPARAQEPVAQPVDARPAGNLPPELTSLIGRERDIERVARLVSEHRLVSVVGPGGVGKTRLARRVAADLGDDFEDGVWFADLAAIERAGDVAGAVLSALGISDQPGVAALDTVADELTGRRLLLLLDNCEHVLGSAAQVAARLLSDCWEVEMIATTREPLAVPGECVARLEPLATAASGSAHPAAVELFLDRAATHGVSWDQPDRVLGAIQQVCERLDGIPLAIELAAARTRAISPADLLTRLDDRLRLLARPGHWSAYARQQTLEAAIAWSYALLSPDEQATLRRVAVFHGGFSLAAAVAVCADIGGELDTLDRVTALVDRSVVGVHRRHDGARYRLLESIGLFAEQRLREAHEQDHARDRHARFFLELVRQTSAKFHGSDAAARAARLEAEQDNLIAALGWCLESGGDRSVGAELAADLGLGWTLGGRLNSAKRWLERALELGEEVAPATRVSVRLAYVRLTYSTGDLHAGRASAAQAAEIARQSGDLDTLAEALSLQAVPDPASGRLGDATPIAAELRSLSGPLDLSP